MASPSVHEATQQIKRFALEAGFDLVGVAAAGPIDHSGRLTRWLEKGCHAGMAWMAHGANTRRDLKSWMPEARAVIVCAVHYGHPRPVTSGAASGRLSRYAWGADYHRVLMERLKVFQAEISQLAPGARSAAAVDTSPIMEKAWAERAGLGWIGKNTTLLTPEFGSYVFLGILATELELEADTPMVSRCGSCGLCLEACPMGALEAPGVLDARRCLSYLTIEHRGGIPEESRPGLGNLIFGCDACQECCPANVGKAEGGAPAFAAGVAELDLLEILNMSKKAFADRFKGTPIYRAHWEGLQRNALIVAGNIGSPKLKEAVRALARTDEEPVIREAAAWALKACSRGKPGS